MTKNTSSTYDSNLLYLAHKHCDIDYSNMQIDWIYNPKTMLSEKSVTYQFMDLDNHFTARQLLNMDSYGQETA